MRFIEDAGYVVTFRQTDPLYTVDLSDPRATRGCCGELKIPGYSAYLHPAREATCCSASGQDATEQGAQAGHPAVAVRRVRPAQAHAPARSGRWARTPRRQVEYDHHAFLWWAPAKLAVVPVEDYGVELDRSSGAIGFGVDPRRGHRRARPGVARGRGLRDADPALLRGEAGGCSRSPTRASRPTRLATLAEEGAVRFPPP